MGADLPKQLIELSGKPILIHTIERFSALSPEIRIVLVLHASILEKWPDLQKSYFPDRESTFLVTKGADSRCGSVYAGLKLLSESGFTQPQSLVAIHDGVRPFVGEELLNGAFQMAADTGSAVVGVPVKSSIREIGEGGSKAVDRSRYFHVQTPQVFSFTSLWEAYSQRSSDAFTDDASLMEAAGHSISLYEGSYENIKITTPEDLAIAEIILRRQG